jgi:CheY-like chemotaxis protein
MRSSVKNLAAPNGQHRDGTRAPRRDATHSAGATPALPVAIVRSDYPHRRIIAAVAESGRDLQRRGILIALRAAAIVIIATGVNDVIAGARPEYEPLYAYLAAIALVVLLDGVVLGTLSALVAVAFYALLFIPRGTASLALLFPLGASFATIVASGVVRGAVRARKRAAEPVLFPHAVQSLLVSAPAAVDHTKVLSAIDELRDDLHAAVSELTAAREREAATQQAYADARDALGARLHHAEEESARRAAEAETERTERTHLETAARAQADESTRLLAEAREEAASLVARVTELELGRSESEADGYARQSEAATLRARVEELEQALADVAGSQADGERALLDARAENSDLLQRLQAFQDELRVAPSDRRRVAELERELAAERTAQLVAAAEYDEKVHNITTRVAEDHQAALNDASAEAEDARTEAGGARAEAHRLAERVQALEDELRQRAADVQARETDAAAARAEADSLAMLVASLQEELRSTASGRDEGGVELATMRARIAELEQTLASTNAGFDERLSTIVAHLAEDHEADLGKAMEEKEEARAEARSLHVRLTALQRKVEEERQLVTAKVRDADEHFRHSQQEAARMLAETRAAAQREIDKLRARVAELEQNRVAVPRTPAGVRPRILIAHPDADLRMNARASLERAGYEIFSAADGLEALRTAIAERPAIVIADAVMPKMDGRELCQLLKSQEKTAHIRVVLLTRANDAPPRGDLPPDEILRKPVPLETLKATLAALLAG